MSEFYQLSPNGLLACTMLAALTIILQTLVLTYGLRRLGFRGEDLLDNLAELTVLLHLLTYIRLLAETSYHARQGFVDLGGHDLMRWALFGALSVLCGMISWKKRLFWPLTAPMAAAMTLPLGEKLAGAAFPVLAIGTQIFWLLRSVHLFLLRLRAAERELSTDSVKEAVDTLDTGLLFCRPDGQILLQNRRMQELMLTLAGSLCRDGRAFYEDLQEGRVAEHCRKGEMGDQLAYWLPDGTVWVFELHRFCTRNKRCYALLSAADTTRRWKATHQLWEQNREMEERNRELKKVLDNLETICRTEETIRAKSRVHDVLGQRISLLLRAMREHREPDEVLLQSFADGLPRELTSVSAGSALSLDTLTEVFRGLGVTVRVEGSLPEQETLARTFFEIAEEAVTNSVRHGYASEITVRLRHGRGSWTLDVTDNGLPVPGPVSEGGGLKGMRRKAAALGGWFSYSTEPHFHIRAEIPEEGTI